MQQPLSLLNKNATTFSEHEAFVDCFHSNTGFLLFLYFSKKCENNGKNYQFNPFTGSTLPLTSKIVWR
jgi:hypothetical protein